MRTDSKAAIDHSKRLGQGRLKHVALKANFIQELIHSKRVSLLKIPGEDNPADILTKAVTISVLRKLMCSPLISLGVVESDLISSRDHVERILKPFSDVDFDHQLAFFVI